MKNKLVLYLTYDGINDPLGKSQIIPYINLINQNVNKIIVISFEKKIKKNFNSFHHIVLNFTDNFGKLGKLYDMLKFFIYVFLILIKYRVDIIHSRSHLPTFIAVFFKFFFKFKLIFDFRGLWLEERFENKSWKNNIFYKIIYFFLKKYEFFCLKKSTKIIVLTKKFKLLLLKQLNINPNNILVIPCVNDFKKTKDKSLFLFKKKQIKLKLGLNDLVFGYVGSFGGIYDPVKILDIYCQLKKTFKNASLLILTNNRNYYFRNIKKYNKFYLKKDIKVLQVDHAQIQNYLYAIDIGINYIKQGYPRIAQSPTRIGEFMMSEIPIITNSNIGDIDDIIRDCNIGYISKNNFNYFLDNKVKITYLLNNKKNNKIIKIKNYYSIQRAKKNYKNIYN